MRDDLSDAPVREFLERPDAGAHIERLQTYLHHRSILWRDWKELAEETLGRLRTRAP